MKSNANSISIEFDARAAKEIRKLSGDVQQRIIDAVDTLLADPLAGKPLSGFPHLRRIRVGDYRVIYTFKNDRLIVLVLRVGHRRDIYRNI